MIGVTVSLFGKKEAAGAHPECAGLVQHCNGENESTYDSEIVDEWLLADRAHSVPAGQLQPSSGKPLANNLSYTL